MAGVVRATAYYRTEHAGSEIYPDVCPVADSHRRLGDKQHAEELKAWREARGLPQADGMRPAGTFPRCVAYGLDGNLRHCRYYYGLALKGDETLRVHLSILEGTMREEGRSQQACTVLCVGANRNRPPGV